MIVKNFPPRTIGWVLSNIINDIIFAWRTVFYNLLNVFLGWLACDDVLDFSNIIIDRSGLVADSSHLSSLCFSSPNLIFFDQDFNSFFIVNDIWQQLLSISKCLIRHLLFHLKKNISKHILVILDQLKAFINSYHGINSL